MVAVMLALAASALVPPGVAAAVQVAPLATRLTAAVDIGRRGVGWTCFPAGSLQWRDVSFDPAEAARVVAAALAGQGVEADVLPAQGERAGRVDAPVLSGTIRSIAVKACSPHYGLGRMLGGGARVKGKVAVGIDWAVRHDGGAPRAFTTQTSVDVAAGGAGYEVFLTTALAQAATQAAAWLKPAAASR